jgi:hypothetical protein
LIGIGFCLEIFQFLQNCGMRSDVKSDLDQVAEFERQFLKASPSITPFGKRRFGCWINHTKNVAFVNTKMNL